MELREGYKQSEIGLIPKDWGLKKLEDLIDKSRHIRYGVVQPGKYTQDGCLMLRSQDYSKGWKSISTMHRVNMPIESLYKGTKLKKGDLVITIVGAGIAQVVEVPKYIEGTLLSRSTARIAINGEKAISKLILQFLSSSLGKEQVLFGIKEGAQPVVSANDVGSCLIPLPPTLEEQKAIATALSDVDALITSLDQLITKKKAIKQGAMHELLTPPHKGGKRLDGFSGEWEEVRLGDFARINMGQSPLSSNYNTSGNGLPLVQGNADIKNRQTIVRNYTSQITKTADEGDIIMSVRAPVGEIAISSFDCCIGRGVCAIKAKTDFLYHYLVFIEPLWSKFSTGSTFDSINSTQLKATKLFVPKNTEEQKTIAHILSDMDAELEALETKKEKYQQLKQGMMQELLTGKTRLL